MEKKYYDLHIHSCLSPCADNDMTPSNIAGMASLKGLDIIALTDHNTSKNCPAFFHECEKLGVVPVAGMELTTAEDIHLICLFPELEHAMEFDAFVDIRRFKIKNRTDVFGPQIIYGKDDSPAGEEMYFLSNATSLPLEEAAEKVAGYGGIAYPAHVDRQANGIISTLGTFPESPAFTAAEFHDGSLAEAYMQKHEILGGLKHVVSSDAHYLWDINEADNFIMLKETQTASRTRSALLSWLSGTE